MNNEYEKARKRFEIIRRDLPGIRAAAEKMIRDADDEYDAASQALTECEDSPGIPKQEYR